MKKMKTVFKFCSLTFLICTLCLFLSSCNFLKNSSKTLENGAEVTVPDELKEHFLYPEQIPSIHFGYNGINVTKSSTSAHYVFVQNDFYKISDAWGEHLATYKDDEKIIVYANAQTNETSTARFGGEKLPLDEYVDGVKQETSMEYHVVAFGSDGTRYSYLYRTFVSNGKRYYNYAYTDNLTITMELSLMVIDQNGVNKLLLIPLPYDTKYEVGGATLTINSLIKKDTYLEDKYYIFNYPEYLKDLNDEDKVTKMSEWYIKYCEGEYIEDELYINYAGGRFKIDFNQVKNDQKAFKLIYLGSAN